MSVGGRSGSFGGMRIHDGATGTQLQRHLRGDETADDLCVRAPELVREVHAAYLEAGADVVQTNSFLVWTRGSGRRRRHLIEAAHACAVEAIEASGRTSPEPCLAATIGPASSDPRDYWSDLERWLELGARVVRIETIATRGVADAALEAWRDVARGSEATLLLGCSVSPSAGADAMRWVLELAGSSSFPDAALIGLNCCEGPDGLRPVLEGLVERRGEDVVWVDPSAGLPPYQAPGQWAERTAELVHELRLAAVGGCCGTTPEGIRTLVNLLRT